MLHVFKGEVLANMTQVSDVAPGPLVFFIYNKKKGLRERKFQRDRVLVENSRKIFIITEAVFFLRFGDFPVF
jgi:hypothetical protein